MRCQYYRQGLYFLELHHQPLRLLSFLIKEDTDSELALPVVLPWLKSDVMFTAAAAFLLL